MDKPSWPALQINGPDCRPGASDTIFLYQDNEYEQKESVKQLGTTGLLLIIPAQGVVKWNKADLMEPETPANASQSETIGVFNCFHCSSFTLTVFSVNSPWGTRSTASGNQVSRSATPRLGGWEF